MPTSVEWKLNTGIAEGPQFALTGAVQVDAYDRIAVTVPTSAAAAEVEVDIQPGGAGRVRLLLVRSSTYGDNLRYKVHDTGNPDRALNDALFLVGAGALELLEAPLDKLLVINTLGRPATLEILVGRQATP